MKSEIPYVCQVSGCKSIHNANDPVTVEPEDRNQEVTDKIDLKADPVSVKSEDANQEIPTAVKFEDGNQEVRIDLKADPIAIVTGFPVYRIKK